MKIVVYLMTYPTFATEHFIDKKIKKNYTYSMHMYVCMLMHNILLVSNFVL